MSITSDSMANSSFIDNNPATYNHTLGAGSDRVVIVSVSSETDTGAITGVTYGGVTMTKIATAVVGSGFINESTLWYLLEADLPSDGSNTVSISNGGAASTIVSGCSSWFGVSQTAPSGAQIATNTGENVSSLNLAPTTDNANSLVIGTNSTGATGALTQPSGYTENHDTSVSSMQGSEWFKIESLGSTLLSLTTSRTGTVNRFTGAVISWNEAVAAAGDLLLTNRSIANYQGMRQ